MARYCVVCGRQLRTGRKYCYMHRNAHYKFCPKCNTVMEFRWYFKDDLPKTYKCPKCGHGMN